MKVDENEERRLLQMWLVNGYWPIRKLPSGEWIAVLNMLGTTALCVGMHWWGYRTRFCYEFRQEAEKAWETWDGLGDPSGPWIKQKPEDRYGPGLAG